MHYRLYQKAVILFFTDKTNLAPRERVKPRVRV